ncbi:hypothetical protein JOM56_006950 [Amanita muscaria]
MVDPISGKNSPVRNDEIKRDILRLFNKLPVDLNIAEDAYCQCVPSSAVQTDVSAEKIYNDVLVPSERGESKNGLSHLALSLAAIVALCLHREYSPQSSLERNGTSPYFDLSSLYGTSKTETEKIRRRDGSGMLHPDCFCEDRVTTLPESVAVLLVLWNRYHNHTAKQLLIRNERKRWHGISELQEELRSGQDEEIFNLARSTTCIHFMNVVKEDFIRGLTGIPFVGPSLDLNLTLDKHVGQCYRSTRESYFLYSVFLPSLSNTPEPIGKEQPSCIGNLRRNDNGFFDDSELADVLFKATEEIYSGPSLKNISQSTPQNIEEARKWKICGLNEFRVHLGLNALDSFEKWNKTLAPAVQKLYRDDIGQLELIPGLLGEEPMKNSGFNFGETLTWGLIADIVSRLNSDPRFTTNYRAEELTTWSFNDSKEAPGGCFMAMLPKLLQRTLPRHCIYDNVYCLFPLCTPKESHDRIKGFSRPDGKDSDKKGYSFRRPHCGKAKVLRTLTAIKRVLNDPAQFSSPYKDTLMKITGGYGHFLGFDDVELHDLDLGLTMFSLLPDKGAAKRIGDTFFRLARANVEQRCTKSVDGKRARIDLVGDVIEATCTRWVCETMCIMNLGDEDLRGMTEKQQDIAREGARQMEIKAHEDFAAFHAYIHNITEQEVGWGIRERAIQASRHLSEHLTQQLGQVKARCFKDTVAHNIRGARLKQGLASELLYGSKISGRRSAEPFLFRFMKSVKLNELPTKLVDMMPHLLKLKKKYMRSGQDHDEEEDKARMAVEDHRAIALIIGLVVATSANLSKVCAQAVDFYLNNDKYRKEREEIVKLCKDETVTNEKIMGYVSEAQRIAHQFGVWRDVAAEANIEIDQGGGHAPITVEPGDQVFADFANAHTDPRDFPEPQKVNPGRRWKTSSLYGMGMHKCPALPLIEEILPQLFKAIFSLTNLTPSVDNGRTSSTTLCPDPVPWEPKIFLDETGKVSCYPRRMIVEFDAADLQCNNQKLVLGRIAERRERKLKNDLRRNQCYGLVVLLVLLCLLSIKVISMAKRSPRYSLSFPPQDSPSPSPVAVVAPQEYSQQSPSLVHETSAAHIVCVNPTPLIPWSITQFVPKIEGPQAGEPAPLILYKTTGHYPHQISVVDLDVKDIIIDAWIDDANLGHREVDLTLSVNCGSDFGTCIGKGFSSAYFTVPPGEHTIQVTIFKRDEMGPFEWAEDTAKRIAFTVEECRP